MRRHLSIEIDLKFPPNKLKIPFNTSYFAWGEMTHNSLYDHTDFDAAITFMAPLHFSQTWISILKTKPHEKQTLKALHLGGPERVVSEHSP